MTVFEKKKLNSAYKFYLVDINCINNMEQSNDTLVCVLGKNKTKQNKQANKNPLITTRRFKLPHWRLSHRIKVQTSPLTTFPMRKGTLPELSTCAFSRQFRKHHMQTATENEQ